ncbi:MAG: carbohydrate ABC transporter permease [Clostridia bacterium]|nr:carbohydrate ABC transporter permease [Oscillospiraceae bacterium]MDY5627604.1 carbohydrate ABC transporter permease [Clostridia bacterium]
MLNRMSKSEKLFQTVNYIFLTFIGAIMLYPLLYVFSASVSDPQMVAAGKVVFLPKGNITLDAYKMVLSDKQIWVAYGNTIIYAFGGTFLSLIFTTLGGYPLSKRRLRGRRFFNLMFAFTMWFNGGIIPLFLTIKDYGLLNSRWGILITFLIDTFNLILVRTYFESIPDTMEEAARIDGANDWGILLKIYLPLAKPILATIGLYYLVGKWNSYFWSMVLLRDESKIPLQVVLQKLIVNMTSAGINQNNTNVESGGVVKETVIYTTIVVSVVPMLMIYPFLQKYFVKGIMVGAIKG